MTKKSEVKNTGEMEKIVMDEKKISELTTKSIKIAIDSWEKGDPGAFNRESIGRIACTILSQMFKDQESLPIKVLDSNTIKLPLTDKNGKVLYLKRLVHPGESPKELPQIMEELDSDCLDLFSCTFLELKAIAGDLWNCRIKSVVLISAEDGRNITIETNSEGISSSKEDLGPYSGRDWFMVRNK